MSTISDNAWSCLQIRFIKDHVYKFSSLRLYVFMQGTSFYWQLHWLLELLQNLSWSISTFISSSGFPCIRRSAYLCLMYSINFMKKPLFCPKGFFVICTKACKQPCVEFLAICITDCHCNHSAPTPLNMLSMSWSLTQWLLQKTMVCVMHTSSVCDMTTISFLV